VAGGEEQRPVVQVERRGPVCRLTLDSPANRNALSTRLLAELALALREVQADPDVRAVVLAATGPAFCSGADLGERLAAAGVAGRGDGPGAGAAVAELAGDRASAPVDGPGDDSRAASLPDVLSLLASLPQPVVARVQGPVRAGGMGLVAACDLAVAADDATFAFTEVRVGVAPAVIAVPALRVMGRRAFARWALTGDVFGAAEAVAAGLLTAAVPAGDLDRWVAGAVAGVLRSSPPAVAATKDLLEGLDGRGWDEAMTTAAALSEDLFASPAAAEGMAAFLARRPPSWVVEAPA
jgi:methylglutaconyl-CoA hydratase